MYKVCTKVRAVYVPFLKNETPDGIMRILRKLFVSEK